MTRETPDPQLATWHTSCRVTAFLVESLPRELWVQPIPGSPRRTVRMISGHLHNCRCMWVKTIGRRHRIDVPDAVDRHRVTQAGLVRALARSERAIGRLLEAGLANDGRLTGFSPPDVTHFLAYLIAHEAHHRGQIVLVARQTGHRLPPNVVYGLWQWGKRRRER
jgi:uncharacterized damage-inducible protein DinB